MNLLISSLDSISTKQWRSFPLHPPTSQFCELTFCPLPHQSLHYSLQNLSFEVMCSVKLKYIICLQGNVQNNRGPGTKHSDIMAIQNVEKYPTLTIFKVVHFAISLAFPHIVFFCGSCGVKTELLLPCFVIYCMTRTYRGNSFSVQSNECYTWTFSSHIMLLSLFTV